MEPPSAGIAARSTYGGARGAAPDDDPPTPPAPAPRQRWRLVLARSGDAEPLGGRELAAAWERALEVSGLPIHRPGGRSRPRIAFGAPVPAAMPCERELADLVLTQRLESWFVRRRLTDHVPDGWRLTDLFDIWLGAPALAGQVVAADYRIAVGSLEPGPIATACAVLLEAATLPRERTKGAGTVRYDLRPLVAGLTLAAAGPPAVVRVRTRFDPVLGTGRPEEVVAALAEQSELPLAVESIVRERLILADEMPPT